MRISQTKFKKHIQEFNFKNLYFFYGKEKYVLKHYTDKLQRVLLPENVSIFNFRIFDGKNFNINEFEKDLEMVPVFSSKKCVKITNLDLNIFLKSDFENFLKILENIPKNCVVLISQTLEDFSNRLTPKENLFLKFVEKHGIVLECKQLSSQALVKQLISWAQAIKTNLPVECAEELVKNFGKNLEILKNELLKLCAFCGYKKISQKDLNFFKSKNLESNVFLFISKLVNKNFSSTYKHLEILFFNKINPVLILNTILLTFEDLFRIKVAQENKKNSAQIVKEFNYFGSRSFRVEKAQRNINSFSKSEIISCLNFIVETDFLIKNSKLIPEILIQQLLGKISLLVTKT
ncbi:MAG: DNA polymerase III subunit delta [Oscillospiraceae bacterium]|jgi:DNA polymerase-3 subunit delta|nr:DNA polymerase III subunit delta [Oscillospiraceae bacterium]